MCRLANCSHKHEWTTAFAGWTCATSRNGPCIMSRLFHQPRTPIDKRVPMVSKFTLRFDRRPLLSQVALRLPRLRGLAQRRLLLRWAAPVTLTAIAFVVASCLGSGDGLTSHRITVVPSHETTSEPHAPASVAQDSAVRSPTAGSLPDPAGLDPPYALTSEPVASAVAVDRASTTGSSTGNQRVSLRPKNNSGAGDLLDHWGRRHNGLISARLSQAAGTDGGIAEFRELLEAARPTGGETYVPEFHDGDTLASLGQRRGVTYGRWTGGSADTLSIEFDLEYATPAMRDDRSFRATLDRAGKMWSQRIEDTWTEWERSYGESKGHLIGNYGAKGREVRVGPGGETSTGLVIYMTGQTLAQDVAGWGGARTSAPGNVWEPHTGAIALDNDYVEDAGDASLFATIVHETGHVLGAWLGSYIVNNLDWFSADYGLISSYLDLTTGTWTGPNVVAVHGGPGTVSGCRRQSRLAQWRTSRRCNQHRLWTQRGLRVGHGVLPFRCRHTGLPALRDRLCLPARPGIYDKARDRTSRNLRARGLDGPFSVHTVGIPSTRRIACRPATSALQLWREMAESRHCRSPLGRGRCLRHPEQRQPGGRLSAQGNRAFRRRVDRQPPSTIRLCRRSTAMPTCQSASRV